MEAWIESLPGIVTNAVGMARMDTKSGRFAISGCALQSPLQSLPDSLLQSPPQSPSNID